MAKTQANRVRARREELGLSQVALAAAASLTRQSIGAIEAGRATPAVDVALRLARALDCAVEELFGQLAPPPRLRVEPFRWSRQSPATQPGQPGQARLALARIDGRWVSYPLERGEAGRSADALSSEASQLKIRGEVELLRPISEAQENVVLMGCAPALGLLADRLNARPGPGRFLWFSRSSTGALAALMRRQTHVAGVHLVDGKTGEANVPDVRRHAGRQDVALITLARWEAGFVTAAGNPHGISSASSLGQRGLRLVAREDGSGARRLLERELTAAGLPLRLARSAAVQAAGHLEVSQAVAMGAADVGVATQDAALAFGLHFIPIAEERYDLAIPLPGLTEPRLGRLLDMISTAAFRRELTALGYDTRPCGERVAEIRAA